MKEKSNKYNKYLSLLFYKKGVKWFCKVNIFSLTEIYEILLFHIILPSKILFCLNPFCFMNKTSHITVLIEYRARPWRAANRSGGMMETRMLRIASSSEVC